MDIEALRQKFLSYLIPEQALSLPPLEKPKSFRKSYGQRAVDRTISERYNHGKEYFSYGKAKRGRNFSFKKCSCTLQCRNHFNAQDLYKLFEEFWNMGNLMKRRECIFRWCNREKVDKRYRYSYSLPKKMRNVRVCRQFFCQTLDVSFAFVAWTLGHKISDNGTHCLPDKRGGRRKCLQDEQFEEIIEAFNGEKIQPSHYGRKDSSKFYFDATKTFSSFYKKYSANVNPNVKKVSYSTFVKVVRVAIPNLSFKRKSRDKCDMCRLYETSTISARVKLEKDYLEHLQKKDAARKAKADDMARSRAELSRGDERTFMVLEVCVYCFRYFTNL